MVTCLPYPSMHHHRYPGVSPNSAAASPSYFISVASNFDRINNSSLFSSHCSFPPFQSSNPRAWSVRCQASSPGPPPPPPKLEPPSGENQGALSTFSQLQDAIQIFFAVLFWMSLFFWSCVWDGRNNGPSNKGRFRR